MTLQTALAALAATIVLVACGSGTIEHLACDETVSLQESNHLNHGAPDGPGCAAALEAPCRLDTAGNGFVPWSSLLPLPFEPGSTRVSWGPSPVVP